MQESEMQEPEVQKSPMQEPEIQESPIQESEKSWLLGALRQCCL